MKELTISVKIADRPYRLTIKREDEELVRQAASSINKKIKNYSDSYAFNDKQDLLAMVALEETTSRLNKEKKLSSIDNDVVTELNDINELLENHLNE